jgi:hypothetical protein
VCCHIGQISPVEVQHAQETAELTGCLGRLAVLKMGYSFQRLRALDRHVVTKEGDLRCSEDALCQVDEDPIPLKSVIESL